MYIQKVPKPKDAVRINSEQDIPDFLKDTIRIEGDKIISLAAEGYNEALLGSVIGFDQHAPTETGKGAQPLGADSIVEKAGVFYPASEIRTATMIEGPYELDTEQGKQTLDEGKGLLVTRPNGDQNILNLDTSSAVDYMLCTDSGENVGTLKQLFERIDMSMEEAFKIVIDNYPNLSPENGKEAYLRLAQAEMEGYQMPPAKELQEAHDAFSVPDKLIVHGGVFHADDVSTAAVLRELNPDLTVERAFKVPEDRENNTIIADIGGGRFDHHKKDKELREDGNPYAAIGLVLRDFDDRIFPDGVSEQLQNDIQRIEDADNGIGSSDFHVISNLVHYMNPTWDSKENPNQAFENAVHFVQDNYIEPYMEKGYLTEKEQEVLS